MNREQRVKNLMLGLAFGDAISWPSMYHRSRLLPPWTRRVRREMDAASEEQNVLRIPQPFSLNRPSAPFALGPTDDTEWAAFAAGMLVRSQGVITVDLVKDVWSELARSEEKILGSISVACALENIRRGKLPPVSGRDNPHYFDDSALIRAAVIGAAWAGNAKHAAELAAIDASATNAEEGVWGAQAVASLTSQLCAGAPVAAAVAACLDLIPSSSLIARALLPALEIAAATETCAADLVLELQENIVNKVYSYACSAAETLALSLALLVHGKGEFERTVTLACAFAKTADGVPALTGALCGACADEPVLSPKWQAQVSRLKGISIPSLAGVDYLSLIEQIAQLAMQKNIESDL
jgi:ADP-ribosylglycohydrolase